VGVRGSLIAVLLGVLVAAGVLRLHERSASAETLPSPPTFAVAASTGSDVTVSQTGPDALQIDISSESGSCSPDGGVPAGVLHIPVRFVNGRGRAKGAFRSPVTFQGRRVPRVIRYEIVADWTGDEVGGSLLRVDRFAGRTCVRQSLFSALRG
jgi:hypothetical protein